MYSLVVCEFHTQIFIKLLVSRYNKVEYNVYDVKYCLNSVHISR